MTIRTCALVIFAAAMLAPWPAAAASFDCRQAQRPDEVAVCRTADLSQRDTEMGALFYAYSRVPMMMGSNGARRDDAQAFLAQRAGCGSGIACLRRRYAARIVALKAGIDGAMQEMFRLQNASQPCPDARAPG